MNISWRESSVKKIAVVSILAFSICGCSRNASLVPSNVAAAQIGPIQAHFKAYGMGTGEVSMSLPAGETMTGRYQLDRKENIVSYNTELLVAVFGKGTVQSTAQQMVNGAPEWSPGTVDVASAAGTSCHCELMNNNLSGHGQGACALSNGALFRLDY